MSKSEISFVVIVILITAGISLFQLKDGERKTRDAQRKSDVELVSRKLQAFYGDHKFYPQASDSGEIISCGLSAANICQWGKDSVVDSEYVTYIQKLPVDPLSETGRKYVYTLLGAGKFRIYVALERPQDKSIKKDLTISCGNALQCNWYVEN